MGKQQGKRRQTWTERALRRAERACPDRLLRLNLRTGVLEMVPTASAAEIEKPYAAYNPFDIEAERLRKLRKEG